MEKDDLHVNCALVVVKVYKAVATRYRIRRHITGITPSGSLEDLVIYRGGDAIAGVQLPAVMHGAVYILHQDGLRAELTRHSQKAWQQSSSHLQLYYNCFQRRIGISDRETSGHVSRAKLS